jgi:hypothetical protein
MHRNITIVSQEPVLFAQSIYNNIVYGLENVCCPAAPAYLIIAISNVRFGTAISSPRPHCLAAVVVWIALFFSALPSPFNVFVSFFIGLFILFYKSVFVRWPILSCAPLLMPLFVLKQSDAPYVLDRLIALTAPFK